jgi:neopullulanase
MRVLGDVVLNHLHEEHPYVAQRRQEGWFNLAGQCVCGAQGCGWDERPLDCWFTPYLPDVNWRSAAAADQLVEDALFWIREASFDGFRVDAVKHLERVATRTLAGRLNELGARTGVDYLLLGETFTGVEGRALLAASIGPHELDGQFDFPAYWPWVDALGRGQSLTLVDQALLASERDYPPGTRNALFIGNHDVPRFISIAAEQVEADPEAQAWGATRPPETVAADLPFERLRDALTLLLTSPAIPLLYYGDEVGLPGAGDPDNRRPMRFGAALSAREAALLEHARAVGAARVAHPALRGPTRHTLAAEDDLLVFQRDAPGGAEAAVVVIYRGQARRTLTLTVRGSLAQAAAVTLTDLLSGRTTTVSGGKVTLTLERRSAAVYLSQP